MATINIPKITLISDFTLGNFVGQFRANKIDPLLEVMQTDFAQVYSILCQQQHDAWNDATEKVYVIWTHVGTVSTHFPDQPEAVLKDVVHYSELIVRAAQKAKAIFVALWVPPNEQWINTSEFAYDGPATLVHRMNLQMIETLKASPNVKVLNTFRWLQKGGENAISPRLWYTAKVPYSNEVFAEAVREIKWHLRSLLGAQRKLIVCDLDDTLWGGILGDDGWENLKLGGHDPVGEAFKDFQSQLKYLKSRGVLLALASKNDEANALHAIRSHPEMVLKESDFAAWRINWRDKAANIAEMIKELNLGAQSVVFLDDNPVERARVRDMLPEVLVPDWPENKLMYSRTLLGLGCFDIGRVTDEDLKRTEMYRSEKSRDESRHQFKSDEDWLATLHIKVTASNLSKADLVRASQLFNKTNQLNLATRRLTEKEFWDEAQDPSRTVKVIRVSDKFGDLGLVGIIGLRQQNTSLYVEDFILSCRVIGRQVEELMLWLAAKDACDRQCQQVVAKLIETSKNKPMLDFMRRSGWPEIEDKLFKCQSPQQVIPPKHITID